MRADTLASSQSPRLRIPMADLVSPQHIPDETAITHCLLTPDLYARISPSRRLITACSTPLPTSIQTCWRDVNVPLRTLSPCSLYGNGPWTLVYSSVGIQGMGSARALDERSSRTRYALPSADLTMSPLLHSPLVLSLVDRTLDALERLG